MSKSKRYLTIAGGIAIVLIIILVGFFFFSQQNRNKVETTLTPEAEYQQTINNPDTATTNDSNTNNSDLASQLKPDENMEQVIDKNKDNINNNDEVMNQLAQSYPSELIPIYRAVTAADSADIITDNGKPGWTANYGSDATVDNIATFYQSLLSNSSDYQENKVEQSEIIRGTVDDCTVNITVSPNNPERTGLSEETSVSIYIEKN